jgi:hypothetical protein
MHLLILPTCRTNCTLRALVPGRWFTSLKNSGEYTLDNFLHWIMSGAMAALVCYSKNKGFRLSAARARLEQPRSVKQSFFNMTCQVALHAISRAF